VRSDFSKLTLFWRGFLRRVPPASAHFFFAMFLQEPWYGHLVFIILFYLLLSTFPATINGSKSSVTDSRLQEADFRHALPIEFPSFCPVLVPLFEGIRRVVTPERPSRSRTSIDPFSVLSRLSGPPRRGPPQTMLPKVDRETSPRIFLSLGVVAYGLISLLGSASS